MAQTSTSGTGPLLLPRLLYVALALGTIALGLGVHWYGAAFGPTVRDVIGDALWAAMIAWWVAALVPGSSLRGRGVVALAICFAVELSQLYATPTLDALRHTTAGHLVLGSGFDLRDLLAYTLGVLAAALIERTLRVRFRGDPRRAAA
jgi:hypothetical protein